jgi:hypothetical protein
MLKIFTFAPPASTNRIIEAMAEAGAGIIGNYTQMHSLLLEWVTGKARRVHILLSVRLAR